MIARWLKQFYAAPRRRQRVESLHSEWLEERVLLSAVDIAAVAVKGSGVFFGPLASHLETGSSEKDSRPSPQTVHARSGPLPAADAANFSLDVDGDGSFLPLTDGILMIRYLAGSRGASLIDNAVNASGTLCLASKFQTAFAATRLVVQ